jgi:hypothetical protein
MQIRVDRLEFHSFGQPTSEGSALGSLFRFFHASGWRIPRHEKQNLQDKHDRSRAVKNQITTTGQKMGKQQTSSPKQPVNGLLKPSFSCLRMGMTSLDPQFGHFLDSISCFHDFDRLENHQLSNNRNDIEKNRLDCSLGNWGSRGMTIRSSSSVGRPNPHEQATPIACQATQTTSFACNSFIIGAIYAH